MVYSARRFSAKPVLPSEVHALGWCVDDSRTSEVQDQSSSSSSSSSGRRGVVAGRKGAPIFNNKGNPPI